MKDDRHKSHDPGEYLKGRGEAKAEGLELIDPAIRNKPEVTTAVGMYRNLKIDGNHPVVPKHRTEDRLVGLHLESC